MHASWKRSAIATATAKAGIASSFLAAGLATVTLVGGCGKDTDSADRDLVKKVAAVQPRGGGRVEDRKLEVQELQKALQVQGVSDRAKVHASLRLADAESAVGDALAREAADREIEAARLGGEVRALTAQIRSNNVAVAGYRGMEPKAAQQAIDEQKDAATKGKQNGLWIPDGASPVPAQQTVAADIEKLNKEIADLQAKRSALETEQAQATQQADKLTEDARQTKGQKALELGIEAAGLRKKSRDAGAQMEALDLQISHDQQDLKIALSRQAVLAEAIKGLDAHKGELDAAWSQVSERMKGQTTLSQKLLGDESAGGGAAAAPATPTAAAPTPDATAGGAPGGKPAARPVSAAEMEALARQNTIAVKAQRIAELVSEAADRRREALDAYGAAHRHINEAQQAAEKVDAELVRVINDPKNRTASERPAWEGMREVLTKNRFTFRQAMIDDKEAAVHATAAAGLAWRGDLKSELQTVLQTATLTPPAVVDAKPFGTADEAKAEREAAIASYKDAEDKLASIDNEQGSPAKQEVSRAARALLATTQYARSQFLARMGDTAAADQARKTAIDTIKQIKEENWPLPAVMAPELAAAIGITPITPATRPAAGPTTAPTTAPSAETPPDQGAAPGTPATAPATEPATTTPTTEPNPTAPPTAAPDAATAPPGAAPIPTAPPPAASPTTPPPAAPTTPPPAAPTTPPPAAPTTPPPATPATPPPAGNPNVPPPAAPVNK